MDRYIVKTPRPPKEKAQKSPGKKYKQTTIESLKGVVVVEEVLRLKSVLKLEGQSKENLVDALRELRKKIPSRDVLKSTKIGHTVNRLTKHEDSQVSTLAGKVVKLWKEHFEGKADQPKIEVRCDLKTQRFRKGARKLLAGPLGLTEEDDLPDAIERETFHQHGKIMNDMYRWTVRAMVNKLKYHSEVKESLIQHKLDIKDFVTEHKGGKKHKPKVV